MGAGGPTLLDHFARRHRHSPPEVWQARIGAGEVAVDGQIAGAADRLRPGQVVEWRRPPWEEPAVPLAFAVLHRDTHLLAVAKPRGLPTVPNGGFLTHTLLHLVARRFPGASPLHRLGRGTSGLVLFARSDDARRVVSAAWRAQEVEKSYRARVAGVPPPAFTVDVPIGPVPHPRLGEVHAASPGGRPARSHVRLLAAQGDEAIVDVHIETGRPHQIRIHLAAAGFPLIGDPLYVAGGQPGLHPGLPGDGGYRLHAHRLRLRHPATGAWLDLECAPPAALRG